MNDANPNRPILEYRSTPVPVLSLAKWGLGWGVSAWVLPVLITSRGASINGVPTTPVKSWMSPDSQLFVVIVALGVSLWALWRVHRSHGQVGGKAYALAGVILAGAKLIWLTMASSPW